jgi:hypothetical protein
MYTSSPLFSNTQKLIFKLSKFGKKITEIANDICYKHVKSQYELFYIQGYTKMQNLKNCIMNNFSSLCSLEYKVVGFEILYV